MSRPCQRDEGCVHRIHEPCAVDHEVLSAKPSYARRVSEQAPGIRFSIRRGRSTDFDAVKALHSAVAAEGLWLGAEAPVEWTPEREDAWCRTADEEDRGAWFLAEDDCGHLLGSLSVTRSGT